MVTIRLSGLTVYPIKSAAGIGLSQAEVTLRGLLHDRRWMVCDRTGKFLTQRQLPKMALIQVTMADGLRLSIGRGDTALELPAVPQTDPVDVTVWGDTCTAWSMGSEVAQWLSDFLGLEAQLV
ncbi:MAG: MOSC domain-containing protein, partial [Symploca sp. SIO2G7]|nr:MOSC domain-containing protein [Symploca sp. SIO2G7]